MIILLFVTEIVGLPAAQTLVLAILGLVGSLITQFVKQAAGTSDTKAYLIALGISIVISALAVFMSGVFATVSFSTVLVYVLATSTFTYQVVLKNLNIPAIQNP